MHFLQAGTWEGLQAFATRGVRKVPAVKQGRLWGPCTQGMDLMALLLSFLMLVAAKQEGALQFAVHVPRAFLEQGIRSFNTHSLSHFSFSPTYSHTLNSSQQPSTTQKSRITPVRVMCICF